MGPWTKSITSPKHDWGSDNAASPGRITLFHDHLKFQMDITPFVSPNCSSHYRIKKAQVMPKSAKKKKDKVADFSVCVSSNYKTGFS